MEQESIFKKRIAIVGAGPAGCFCAKQLQDAGLDVTLFDKGKFLQTILPTGGGRCNLAHSEFNFKELAKNYPRGEKFLYSIFSRFSTQDSINFFKSIGIKTYTQYDNRIFPTSNSAKEVRSTLLKAISKCNFENEKVTKIEKTSNCYKLTTEKSTYAFDVIVISIGGHSNFDLIKNLGINIIEPTPALVGLTTKEDFSKLSGLSLKAYNKTTGEDSIMFTHKGISGPLVYKYSSIQAREKTPYKLTLRFIEELNLQQQLDNNSHKEIKNLIGQYVPKSFATWILNDLGISPELPCYKINGKQRDSILNKLTNFEITITGKVADSEVVTCGGVDLKEINPKTMESKKYQNLYFCGEVLDIDGFCGGFNLQNCWSTGYVVAQSIVNNGY